MNFRFAELANIWLAPESWHEMMLWFPVDRAKRIEKEWRKHFQGSFSCNLRFRRSRRMEFLSKLFAKVLDSLQWLVPSGFVWRSPPHHPSRPTWKTFRRLPSPSSHFLKKARLVFSETLLSLQRFISAMRKARWAHKRLSDLCALRQT